MKTFSKDLFIKKIIFFVLLVNPFFVYSANEKIEHISNNNGLSNSSVVSIFQDSDGFLWFGTWDGLNRYNSLDFNVYRPSYNNKHSISNNIIRNMFEESKDKLWVVTDYGINRLDKLTGNFQPYYLGYNNINTVKEQSFHATRSQSGAILAAAYNFGLYIFHPQKLKFIPIIIKGIETKKIIQMFFDKLDNLWLLNESGKLYKIRFSHLDYKDIKIVTCKLIAINHINKICYDNDDKIWYMIGENLYYIKITDSNLINNLAKIKISGVLNSVLKLKNHLFFAMSNGLFDYDELSRKISTTIQSVSILSIYRGTQNILWVGTDTKGIYKILPLKSYFSTFNKENVLGLTNYSIRAIYMGHDNYTWIGNKGGGLISVQYLGSRRFQKTKHYTTSSGLVNNSILALSPAKNQDFWIGTDGHGINYFSNVQHKIKSLNLGNNSLYKLLYSVYCILQTNDTTLWIGTSGNGLFKLTIKNSGLDNFVVTKYLQYYFRGNFLNEISGNIIYSIIQQDDRYLWIATRGGGLNRLDLKMNKFSVYKNESNISTSLSCNDVITIFQDRQRRIWVGTGFGLNLLKRTHNGQIYFKRYFESDGLASSNIHGILEDDQNDIWVSTSHGLSRIDTRRNIISNYLYSDGLQDSEFSDGAAFSSNNGQNLYFGGINGFNVVHPSQIKENVYSPKIYLTSFEIDNKKQPLSLNYMDDRIISYKSNSINFHFSIPDYLENQKYKLAYKVIKQGDLSSFRKEDNWIYVGNNRDIAVSNIFPGKYELLVKYTNSDNLWNKNYFHFRFRITTPWYKSAFAYFLYICIFFSIIFLIFYFRMFKMEMKHQLELENLKRIKEEDIHEAKLKFFTNIAHEFSNSITLIYGSCEQILDNTVLGKNDKRHLSTVKNNAERMQGQIQQLMDFRKAETGYLPINYEEIDIVEMIKYTLDDFLDMADMRKINMKLDLHSVSLLWVTDRKMLEKIIFNLLSNALKYTSENGDIFIKLEVPELRNEMRMSIINTGKGISPENLSTIFNRFKVLDNFESELSQGLYSRNGIGLAMCQDLVRLLKGNISVKSQIDEYTEFVVTLPWVDHSQIIQPKLDEQIINKNDFSINSTLEEKDKTILIVDDQPEINLLISDILSPIYKTETALGGDEALKWIKEHSVPDLIICDILMPVMDGIALLKKLKAEVQTKYIPIIVLSSKISIESQIECLDIGADMFIGKPFHPHHLQAAVSRLLGNKGLMQKFVELPQAYSKIADKANADFINKAINLLVRNLDNEDYNQGDLASDLAMSRVQFYRKIKKITNETPAEFIRNFRLKEVEKMLKQTDKTISEVMNDCGFKNKSYFYRTFLKEYQCTPKEFRLKFRQI